MRAQVKIEDWFRGIMPFCVEAFFTAVSGQFLMAQHPSSSQVTLVKNDRRKRLISKLTGLESCRNQTF
jgi:hypothetical protein